MERNKHQGNRKQYCITLYMHPLKECLLCVFKCYSSKLGCFKTNWLAYPRGFVLLVDRQEEHNIHCIFFWELKIDSVQFIFKQTVLLAVSFLFNCVFNVVMLQYKMQFSILTQLRCKCISFCNLLIWFLNLQCLSVFETSMLQCNIQICFFVWIGFLQWYEVCMEIGAYPWIFAGKKTQHMSFRMVNF